MTLNEAKAVIYGNVVYACEKAGYPPYVVQLVQDACDTVIALADKTEPQNLRKITQDLRKTENSSEKPNNSTISKMEQVEVELQTDDLQDWKDRMWAEAIVAEPTTEDCSTVPTCSVNGRPYDCGNCEYHKCTADEPKIEVIACPLQEENAEYFKWLYEDEPQTERSE